MQTSISEQFQNSFKPFNEFMAINVKAINSLAEYQTNFFTETLNDGLRFSQNLAEQSDIGSVMRAQREYAESFQSKFLETVRESYAVMTEAQNELTEALRGAYKEVEDMTKKAADEAKKTASKAASSITRGAENMTRQAAEEANKTASKTAKTNNK